MRGGAVLFVPESLGWEESEGIGVPSYTFLLTSIKYW